MTQTAASKDPALVRFGAVVRAQRERANKAAEEVARELGISSKTLYRIEHGVRVSNRVYYIVGEVLGVHVEPVLKKVA